MNKISFNKTKYNRNYILNSLWVTKIINHLTRHTLTHKIENKFYKTYSQTKFHFKTPVLPLNYNTIRQQKLLFKILRVRVAGRIYQLPTNFAFFNRYASTFRWLLSHISKSRVGSFTERTSNILINNSFFANNLTDKLRSDVYQTITSYRGYVHFRWRN